MAITGVAYQPRVVKLGGATIDRSTYLANDTITKGDFIRITSAGTIKIGLFESATLGSVHGLALLSVVATEVCPIQLFAKDTVIRLQCADGTKPEDIAKGTVNELDRSSVTGVWAVKDLTTAGIATVVGYAYDSAPWGDTTGTYSENQQDEDNGFIDIQFGNDINGIPVLGNRSAE